DQQLAVYLVLGAGPPLKIGTEDAGVSAAASLAVCEDSANERGADIMTNAADGIERFEIRGGEEGPDRAGNDRQSTASILRDEKRVGRAGYSAGRARAPQRRGDRARVSDLQRRIEDVEALE